MEQILKLIDERLDFLYNINKDETSKEELIRNDGKISELLHLKVAINNLQEDK